MKNQTVNIQAELKKETAKAILLKVTAEFHQGLKALEIWFPKSQATVLSDGLANVAQWLLLKKAQEVTEQGFIGFIEE
tara:strand:+ start:807 stop:1040 length:234 start_codon:yes stop_codon:yes gene_type:complete